MSKKLLSLIVAVVLALIASFLLYRVRKTERAEHTLAFDWLHPVLGVVLPLMGGTALGIVMMLSFGTEISLVTGMVLGAALTYWLCRIVFTQRFSGILGQWYLPAASAALLVLGALLAVARVVSGVHFVRDVVSGAVIGVLSAVIGFSI